MMSRIWIGSGVQRKAPVPGLLLGFSHGPFHLKLVPKTRSGGGRRDGVFLTFFWISRAAFDTLKRAKHWTAFHVAQTIVPKTSHD